MLGKTKREHLVDAIRFFSDKGWTPATSSNFSFRETSRNIVISRSGVDKSRFAVNDLIQIDNDGKVLKPAGEKSSAETLIHCCAYRTFPHINCVLHTHSVHGTVMSKLFKKNDRIIFKDYEVLKAFEGVKSHDVEVELPIFSNTQDMNEFQGWLEEFFSKSGFVHGILIEGHGLYTWAKSIEAAKRQIEAFEFLMECELLERREKAAWERMIKFALMDVEGTTTDIRFVKNELFPYAYEKMDEYVASHFESLGQEAEALGVHAPEELAARLKRWIEQDKKEPVLKSIQGKIWREGYEKGDLKGHVYPDVEESLKKWKKMGVELGIYSSGSVEAQKLLYKNSVSGDLTELLSRHFDLKAGKKYEEISYRNILSEVPFAPEETLFLSDIEAELDAARAAGMKTCRIFRDGLEESSHPRAEDFHQVDVRSL